MRFPLDGRRRMLCAVETLAQRPILALSNAPMPWLSKLLRKLFTIREQSQGDVVKPFLDHLEDLRVMIFKILFTVLAGTIVAYYFHAPIMELLKRPLGDLKLISTGMITPFMISLKMSFYMGIVLTFPILLYHVAIFVLPALTRQEKRLLIPGVIAGFVLFGIGVVISYTFILPKTIVFFRNYAKDSGIDLMLDAGQYYSLVANLCLACGLLCELPVVIIALSAIGLVSFKLLSATRTYAVTAILILVAVIAPSPDPFTFLMMAIPVIAIYELCIWIVWLMERRRAKKDEITTV